MMETLPSLVKKRNGTSLVEVLLLQFEIKFCYLAKGIDKERKTIKKKTERLISNSYLVRNLGVYAVIFFCSFIGTSSSPTVQNNNITFAKRQKTSEYEAYVSGESSSGQVNIEESGPSTLGNQEQDDEFDFWTNSYASDDDEIPTKQKGNSCIFLSIKITPLVQSCQRDPEAPSLSLINQDLLYLKKGNSGPEKIVLSLHKFPAIVFNDDDIEERTSRWVNKCIKKFNPYARYGVETRRILMQSDLSTLHKEHRKNWKTNGRDLFKI
ncbi:hypothetical protein Tco_0932638 [Tanacetum coccineum]